MDGRRSALVEDEGVYVVNSRFAGNRTRLTVRLAREGPSACPAVSSRGRCEGGDRGPLPDGHAGRYRSPVNGETARRDEAQARQEMECVRVFVNDLSRRTGVEYVLQRGTERFPELRDKGDWEFVVTSRTGEGCIGIEVKSRVFADTYSRLSSWERICKDIERGLEGELSGTFTLVPPFFGMHPSWPPPAERRRVVQCLAGICRRVFPTMKCGDGRDLGPYIEQQGLECWPTQPPRSEIGETDGRLVVVTPPEELWAYKTEEEGRDILSVALGDMYLVQEVDVPELTRAVRKANRQLGRARKHGASRTVLLIDEHRGTSADALASAFTGLPRDAFGNVDEVYRVETADCVVRRLFPT